MDLGQRNPRPLKQHSFDGRRDLFTILPLRMRSAMKSPTAQALWDFLLLQKAPTSSVLACVAAPTPTPTTRAGAVNSKGMLRVWTTFVRNSHTAEGTFNPISRSTPFASERRPSSTLTCIVFVKNMMLSVMIMLANGRPSIDSPGVCKPSNCNLFRHTLATLMQKSRAALRV